ncbi:sugar ABC transporter [Babesia caballi]|uniref:Sugar ABC transporter n=1 Tax=Babesia caballi TaxID=5871 RepID=A0AAV4LQI3_BABCB|nr:sugar ABC transporter [Babesia caballi]
MKNEARCIFPTICRISSDCAEKSIFKSYLVQSTPNLLRQVAESRIRCLSPFDSAAILNKILEKADQKGIAAIRRDPFYRPVASKIVASVQLYRRELLFYFLTKFYKLHDIHAIKGLTRVFVQSEAANIQSVPQLVELLYYAAHHIPKELHSDVVRTDDQEDIEPTPKDILDEHLQIYCECVEQLQCELVEKSPQLRDKTLVYKIVTAIAKLPRTQHTDVLVGAILEKVKLEIGTGAWDLPHLVKVVKALGELSVDDDMLQRVICALEVNQDNLRPSDIEEILQLLERLNSQLVADYAFKYQNSTSALYLSLSDKLHLSKRLGGECPAFVIHEKAANGMKWKRK